jgi:putative oxidoreductase
MQKLRGITYFLLRVVSGFLLMQAGGLILFGWYGGMPDGQTVTLMSQTGVGGIIEFFGGSLIMIGLFVRPAAFISSGMMAVAYWQFHFPNARWPIQNNGMPAVLLCFIFLCMAANGAGEWSLDTLVRRKLRRSGTADK